jgi:hypothetical protein
MVGTNRQDEVPTLKDIAYKYLSIATTSVPSEQLFSAAGDIILSK